MVLAGKYYRHYKGNYYYVVALGKHTETGEDLVVYKSSNGTIWIRPLFMWDQIVNGVPRFTECTPPN